MGGSRLCAELGGHEQDGAGLSLSGDPRAVARARSRRCGAIALSDDELRDAGPLGRYKLFGVVTNRTLPGDALIRWQRERCGKSEEAHAVMKDDLAGGRLPSGLFGANAAWWAIMVLAHNLNAMMKRQVLGGDW